MYYYAFIAQTGAEIPLRYDGAVVPVPLHEHDLIEAEFAVDNVTRTSWFPDPVPWSSVQKAVFIGDARPQ